jgi:MFS family permease
MFKKLTDFGYQRTGKEAFGFYLAYFALVILTGGLIGGLFGSLIPESAYQNGFKIGTVLSVGTALVLSYLIMQHKKQTENFKFIVLSVAAGVLGLFGGSLLGLIIPAYMTTQSGKASKVSRVSKAKKNPTRHS